ncbi:hypothetical protein LFZ92_06780 [Salmonella enterica subsp. salamae serovar 57:z29:z42]|nr:hypothetical protein LFZ92_06780 [Salmonella enterica subsp. salamae serovar 57:z29:z42]
MQIVCNRYAKEINMRLNDSVIKNLKATDQSYYVFRNDGIRGTGRLGIKVHPSGRKSFVYRFQLDGKRKFKKLGDWPHYTLDQASQRYAELAGMTHKVRTENFVKKMCYGTLREIFASFIVYKEREGHRSTVNEYKILLDQLIKRGLITGNETANEITPAQVTQWLQSWAKKGFLAQADKIRKKIHVVFTYGLVSDNDPLGISVSNGIEFNIPNNPRNNIQKLNASKPGERYLSFEEIKNRFNL